MIFEIKNRVARWFAGLVVLGAIIAVTVIALCGLGRLLWASCVAPDMCLDQTPTLPGLLFAGVLAVLLLAVAFLVCCLLGAIVCGLGDAFFGPEELEEEQPEVEQ